MTNMPKWLGPIDIDNGWQQRLAAEGEGQAEKQELHQLTVSNQKPAGTRQQEQHINHNAPKELDS